jgi:hypothetical protein
MAKRGLLRRTPIWLRTFLVTTVILVGVLMATMLLAAGGVGDRGRTGGHGSNGGTQMTPNDHTSGDHSGGDHSGGDHSGGDHSGR